MGELENKHKMYLIRFITFPVEKFFRVMSFYQMFVEPKLREKIIKKNRQIFNETKSSSYVSGYFLNFFIRSYYVFCAGVN